MFGYMSINMPMHLKRTFISCHFYRTLAAKNQFCLVHENTQSLFTHLGDPDLIGLASCIVVTAVSG